MACADRTALWSAEHHHRPPLTHQERAMVVLHAEAPGDNGLRSG